MVGTIDDDPQWVTEIELGIQKCTNISYLGMISQEEVNALLAKASILVNTSYYEGFSNTFIQAWMRRVSVISLYVDPDRLLSSRGLGRVSRTEDQLFEDTQALLNDSDSRDRLGKACQSYALKYHSEENVGALLSLMQIAPANGKYAP